MTLISKLLYLTCEKCNGKYEKPEQFAIWNTEMPNVFFKWSLQYCDTCRKEKQFEALKSLPNVINSLTDQINK